MRELGGVTEWLMVADCKSAGRKAYVGSNPTPTTSAARSVLVGLRPVRRGIAVRDASLDSRE